MAAYHDSDKPNENVFDLELDEEAHDHYAARAAAAGQTLDQQIVYELSIHRGLGRPDPGDEEAGQRGRLFERIFNKRPLLG